MILVRGGLTIEMMGYMAGWTVSFFAILIFLHLRAGRTRFYAEEYVHFTPLKKLLYYLGFLCVSAFLAQVTAFLLVILVARVIGHAH